MRRTRPKLLVRLLPSWFRRSRPRTSAGVWSLRTLIIFVVYLLATSILGPRDIVSHVLSPTGGLSQIGSVAAAVLLVSLRMFLVMAAAPLLSYKWILALWPHVLRDSNAKPMRQQPETTKEGELLAQAGQREIEPTQMFEIR